MPVAGMLLVAAIMLAGCAGPGPDQASDADGGLDDAEEVSEASDAADHEDADDGSALDADAVARTAREATLRLRGYTTTGVRTTSGSAFAVSRSRAITNAHVVVNGELWEASSWRGGRDPVVVDHVERFDDLAVVDAGTALPVSEPLDVASEPAQRGDEVVAVGYPGGGRIIAEDATVQQVRSGSDDGQLADVLVIDADTVEPGSSGGPVVNADGEAVAAVFAIDLGPPQRALAVDLTDATLPGATP